MLFVYRGYDFILIGLTFILIGYRALLFQSGKWNTK